MAFAARATWRSWRWVPAAVAEVLVLAIVYATRSGDALPAFALTAALAVPLTAWLTAAAGNVDDDAHQDLLVAASSRRSVHASRAVVGAAAGTLLGTVATLWPLVAGAVDHAPGAAGVARTLLAGVGAHATGALGGVAVGTFAHRPLLVRPGGAVVVALVGTSGVVLAGVPFLRALGHDDALAVLPALGVGLVAAAVATLVAAWLADRLG